MSVAARSGQFTVRLKDQHKRMLVDAAEQCGIDPSVAIRQVLELIVARLEAGEELIDVISQIKKTDSGSRALLEQSLDQLNRALSALKNQQEQNSILERIEDIERRLNEG